MALTLELEPEVERALALQAARRGVPVERYAAGVLQHQAQNEIGGNASDALEKRRAAVRALRGKRKHLVGTVDDFLRERHEEAQRDMKNDLAADARRAA